MELINVNHFLGTESLFDLFKAQLKKDFEGAGLSGTFTDSLPDQFDQLKTSMMRQIEPLSQASHLPSLLYRVDISEIQLKNYKQTSPHIPFEELVAELIIKRVLQKVILKKKFSS